MGIVFRLVHVNQNLTAFFVSFVDFPASGRFQYIHIRQIYEIECLNYDKDNRGFFFGTRSKLRLSRWQCKPNPKQLSP